MDKITSIKNRIPHGKLVIAILIATIILACAVSYQLFKYKCFWWSCAPDRHFSVFDLNLPSEFFPGDAEIPVLKPDRGILTAVDEARGASNWDGGGAVYIVSRFATSKQAQEWYKLRVEKNFFTAPLENKDPYHEILTYKSSVADDYNINCGYILEQVSCILMARYKEFYILFNGYLSETGMTQKDFFEILKYIDGRMLELLF